MTEQLHRGLYGMVVVGRIGSMKFLPIMNVELRQPAARETLRSLVRKRAGKMPCAGARRFTRREKSILDFGGYPA
jgi:hypothetical protein